MTYNEFNKKTFDFYLNRAMSSFFTLSIDKLEFESLTAKQDVSKFEELKSSWRHLLQLIDNIPQYFGLLAIQCYAASNMHDDGTNAADAYQIRLRDLLNLEDNNQLQILFSGSNSLSPPQVEIWEAAKKYLKYKFHLKLEIPLKTKYAGRYVQYPKSQALLTTEDLRCFTSFFSEEFRVDESLPLFYFEKRFYACLPNIQITNRVRALISDVNKKERCIKQVFNYFNNWNGDIYHKYTKAKQHKSTGKEGKNNRVKNELFLILRNNIPKFYFFEPSSNNSSSEISGDDLFKSKSFFPFYSGLIFFTQSEYYLSEFEESRFVDISRTSYVLVNKMIKSNEFLFLEMNNKNRIEITSSCFLYELNFDEDVSRRYFEKYIQPSTLIKLLGGIRISRKREYLVGYGPVINSPTDFAVIYAFEKHDYNPETSPAGTYKIREDNSKDIEFTLINSRELENIIPPRNSGWVYTNYTTGKNPDVEGCLVRKTNSPQQHISIRDWINVNIGEKYLGDSILLKAIDKSNS